MSFKYLLLFLLIIPVSAHTGVIVFPENQTIFINQTFSFQVLVTPDQNTSGMQIDINYNDSVINISSITDGGLFGNKTYFNPGLKNKSRIKNVFAVILGPSTINKTGALLNISATANKKGTFLINLTNVIISTPDGTAIENTSLNGSITVLSKLEDVNEDGLINTNDIVQITLHIGHVTGIEDINKDGIVNIFDVVLVSRAMT